MNIKERTETHPCYNCAAHKYARMHLSIAPKCNISCNYCVRKFDCPNESRPGVTTEVLTPEQAFEKYKKVKEKVNNLSVVGVAGPGDALANFENLSATLKLVREYDPDVTFCISTNGLMLPHYAEKLAELGVSHITVTMNTVDPEIGGKIYRYVDYMGKRYTGREAGEVLLRNQLKGLQMLSDLEIVCKVNIVMIKNVNDKDIPNVVKKVKELNVVMTNIIQMIPVKGSVFENIGLTSNHEVNQMRKECNSILKQMMHCKQCRADAIGTLDNDISYQFNSKANGTAKVISELDAFPLKKNKLAVCSSNGVIIDQHLGEAAQISIYDIQDGKAQFLKQISVTPMKEFDCENDKSDNRFIDFKQKLSECEVLIATRIGDSAKNILAQMGIRTFERYGDIEQNISEIYEMIR